MHIDPALRQYTSDHAAIVGAQGRVNLAKARWQARGDTRKILKDCSTFAQGAALAECAVLSELLTGAAAADFAGEWLTAMVEAWRADPLAQVPFRHSQSGGVATIQLHRVGCVTLSLIAIEPQPNAPARTISFTDCERHEVVLAGTGRGIAYAFEANRPLRGSPLPLRPGTRFSGDKEHARAILALDAPLVLLRRPRTRISCTDPTGRYRDRRNRTSRVRQPGRRPRGACRRIAGGNGARGRCTGARELRLWTNWRGCPVAGAEERSGARRTGRIRGSLSNCGPRRRSACR